MEKLIIDDTAQQKITSFSISDSNKIFELPLIKLGGPYFFKAKLNRKKVKVMIDFGDNGVLGLFPYSVIKSKASLIKKDAIGVGVDTMNIKLGILDKMNIKNGPVIRKIPFYMRPTDFTVKLFGFIPIFRSEACVGLGFLSKFNIITLDMPDKKIILNEIPQNVIHNSETIEIPCSFDKNNKQIKINGIIDEINCDFILDLSGTQTAITLYGETAKKVMQYNSFEEIGKISSFGRSGDKLYKSKVKYVKMGNYEQKNIEIFLIPDNPQNGGIIGDNFWGLSTIGIDFNKNKMYYLLKK